MLTTLEQLEISLQAIIKHINKVLPKKLSELQNDTGYLTDYTETDPTVPAWAKASTKPTYTAAEVGALSDDTVIPSKVSELTNDAEYITSSDVATPDWNAASGDDGYIDNKPNIRKGTDAKGTGVAEGSGTTASGASSHSEGGGTRALGDCSHAEGGSTTASGSSSHAEGGGTTASGGYSHAEGSGTTASGGYSHAEGVGTKASGNSSHAEGAGTTASGVNSHAENGGTTASGDQSHAEGSSTIAASNSQHVQGKFNIEDSNGVYAHIVGNGTYKQHSNAHTLDWSGNAWYAGKVTVGTAPTADLDVATKKYVDDNTPTVPSNVSAFTNDADYANEQYVDNAITAALADVVGIEYHVCTTAEYDAQTYIPTLAGEAGVIYLVPKPASSIGSATIGTSPVSGNNIYYEFIYNGRSFEMIGDTQVSLDGYLEDSDISTDAQVQTVIAEVFGGE